MIKDDLKIILTDLIPELNKITIDFMTRSGVKKRSDLSKSTSFVVTDKGLELKANYYFQYVSSGRRRGVRKVPIRALIEYIKQYNITPRNGQTINQLAFAIQTAIYKQGINPKNYFDKIIDATSDVTEEVVADDLIEDIADEIIAKMTETKYAKEV